MTIVTLAHQAELERECAIALLGSLLRDSGDRRRLAEDLGYSPTYVSMLQSIDRFPDHPRVETRPFTTTFLQRIASLPLPPEVREQLVHHISLSIRLREQASQRIQATEDHVPTDEVWALRQAHDEAQYRAPPVEAGRLFASVACVGEALIRRLDPARQAIDYLEVLFCLNDVLCAHGAYGRALYYGQLAYELLGELDQRRYPTHRDRLTNMRVNALRAVGIPYKNLGFPRRARAYYDQAERLMERCGVAAEWKQHLCDDKLLALGDLCRFSITEAEALVDQGIGAASPGRRQRHSILLHHALAWCYLQRGNLKKAQAIYESIMPYAECPAVLGLRFRLRLIRGYTRLMRLQGDDLAWRIWLSKGLSLAQDAGLIHDYRTLITDNREKLGAISQLGFCTADRHWTYTRIQECLGGDGE